MHRDRLVWFVLGLGGCFGDAETLGSTTGDCATGACNDDAETCSTAECGASSSSSGTPDPSEGTGESTSTRGDESSDGESSGGEDSTGEGARCGDGQLNQASEMCDGTPGCLADCTFESYDCNPLNDAGCASGFRCGLVDFATEDFACMIPGEAALGGACVGTPSNDADCNPGLTCLFNIKTPECDIGDCCVQYCDLLDQTFECANGATCYAFFPNPTYQGLEHLGFCGDAP